MRAALSFVVVVVVVVVSCVGVATQLPLCVLSRSSLARLGEAGNLEHCVYDA